MLSLGRSDLPFLLAAVALALVVHRGALGAYFTPDDLIYLERVQGIVPEPPTLWRFLSGVAYFHAAHALFGAHALPYMLMNWLLHGLAVAAIYLWVRSAGGDVLAAIVAAALFGTSRLHLTVVRQVVTVAEPLSLILTLAALWMVMRAAWRWRIGALVTFSAALLCKESVMLLPFVLLLPGVHEAPLRTRALRYATLMLPSILILAYISTPAFQSAVFVNDVYQRAYGANLFHNLMTMTGWAADFDTPVADLYSTLSTTAWHGALWVLLGFAALAAAAWRTTRLPALGLAWWLLGLAPVLPLLTQRYLHYLYVPLAGLAIALGGGFEWLAGAGASRSGARRTLGWALAAVMLVGQVTTSEALIARRAAQRLPNVDLPLDPFLRKAETARRVVAAVDSATAGRHVGAVFVIPELGWTRQGAGVLRSILGEGRALRAVCANLDSVAFVSRWSPAYQDFDLFYGRVDGHVSDLGRGPEAHQRLVELLLADQCVADACAELTAAMITWPEHPGLNSLAAQLGR